MENGELYTALLKFQGSVGDIPKNTQGHGYKYADLSSIWGAIRKPLQDAQLVIVQAVVSDGDKVGVRTLIGHISGQFTESTCYAPQGKTNARMSPIQAVGSDITYLRRYGLSSSLGLTTDEDTDGAWIKENEQKETAKKTLAQKEKEQSAIEYIESEAPKFSKVDEFSKLKEMMFDKFGMLEMGVVKIPAPIQEKLNSEFKEFQAREEAKKAITDKKEGE